MNAPILPARFAAAARLPAAAPRPSLLPRLAGLARSVGRAIAARQAAERLHALDDRLLADMGLTRGAIDGVVRGRIPHRRAPW